MTPDRWQQVNRLLEEAWKRAGAERCAFLDEVCSGDPVLRAEVDALLAADDDSHGFWKEPPAGLAELRESVLAPGAPGIDRVPEEFSRSDDLAGTRVGRYTIQGLIGKGGMGAVYRATREDDFHMEVAIKLLKQGTETDTTLDRFRSERQILADLQHPNIARLIDGGATHEGLPYLVMEYVDGLPLLEYAAPLSVRERLTLFRAVCNAVRYAHEHAIVHRDIKPANILVTRDGVPKLLDFGIAKLSDPALQDASLTATGMRLMTPGYASPEQVRGEAVTAASDIYSLGTVLYELLAGRRPYLVDTLSPAELEKQICERDPPPPSAVAKGVDADLDNIVLKAMRKEPERRYGSAEQLAEDVDRFLKDLPVHARKEDVAYRGLKFIKRHRAILAAAVIGGMMVVIAVAGLNRFGGKFSSVSNVTARRPDTSQKWDHLKFEKIAMLGDPAPGGGSFTKEFFPWAVNNRGDIVFAAHVGIAREALFLKRKDDPIIQLARTGDSAPGGGKFSTDIAGVSINDSGDVVFAFGMDPFNPPALKGFFNYALFRYSDRDRTVTQVLVPGVTAAPGRGVFLSGGQRPTLNNRDDMVFCAVVRTPPGASRNEDFGVGIFLMRGGGKIEQVAIPGDPAPGGSAFDVFQNPWINDAGDIAFGAHVAGEECINPGGWQCNESTYFLGAQGRIESIAHQGEQGPLATRYRDAWGPLINNRADIVFMADFAPSQGRRDPRGILLHRGGATVPVAVPAWIMPDGRVISTVNPSFQTGNYGLNNRGEICFNSSLTNGDSAFYVYSQDRLGLIAGTGTVMPGIGTIDSVGSFDGNGGALNDEGQVFFWATLRDKRGVLVLAKPEGRGSK